MKNLFVLSFLLFASIFLYAQPEVFKYRQTWGKHEALRRYLRTDPSHTDVLYTVPSAAGKCEPLINKRMKVNITPAAAGKGDTLFINIWRIYPVRNKNETVNQYRARIKSTKACDPNDEYTYYKLVPNRETVSFRYKNFEISALTVPIKFRFGDSFSGHYAKKDSLGQIQQHDTTAKVLSVAAAQINLNVNFAMRFGRIRYTNDRFAGIQAKNTVSGIFGGFLGFGVLTLDGTNTLSTNTRGDTLKTYTSRVVPSFSFGMSLGMNVRNLDILMLVGYETPMAARNDWDYRRTPFIGFGIGYGSSIFK